VIIVLRGKGFLNFRICGGGSDPGHSEFWVKNGYRKESSLTQKWVQERIVTNTKIGTGKSRH